MIRDARQLVHRLRARKRRLRQRCEAALAADDQRAALALLLELDRRFDPDLWVLESLINVHQQLRLPERGLEYLRRYRELPGGRDLSTVQHEFERDCELWFRNHARLAKLRTWPNAAVENALAAASVSEPSVWTLRILTEAAVTAERRAEARPVIARMRAQHPDDDEFIKLEHRLDG